VDSFTITSIEQLRDVYPPPKARSVEKEVDYLDVHCRRFLELSPLVLVATADRAGNCDVSPKGGPAGFVRVLDDRRFLIPDATGNRRLDSFQNMLANPRVGTLFLIPGMRETLRINGRVELTIDPDLLDGLETGGRPAKLALIVTVDTAYLHCAKALIRSKLWQTDTWSDPDALPSAAEILNDHIGMDDLAASAAALEDSYTNRI
jgi:uncharacterized protein